MLLMVGKGIRRVICHVIHTYAKQNNKYMANYNNCLESIFLMYLDGSNSYRQGMSQKLVKKLYKFDEDFIKNSNETSSKGYIFEVDVEYPKRFI